MKQLDSHQKALNGWVIFSMFVLWIFGLGFFGYGAYAIWKTTEMNNFIHNETSFFIKTFHSDGVCITVSENDQISFSCPVFSTNIPFTPVSVNYQSEDVPIQSNNEQVFMNFQDGIHLPGMDISITNQFNPTVQTPNLADNFYNIDFENNVLISSGGSLIFGETATISNKYAYPDYAGIGFTSSDEYRSFNLFLIGNFNTETSTLSQRCSSSLNIAGSSIYVVVTNSGLTSYFCSCVKLGSIYTEKCTSPLTVYGGISSAAS